MAFRTLSRSLRSSTFSYAAKAEKCSPRLFQSLHCRYLQTSSSSSPPHAYLKQLVPSSTDQSPEELEGAYALVLDRKEARNALSVRMVAELREGIAKAASTPSARLLLLHTPHPGTFCAGADLRERKGMTPPQVSQFLDDLRSLVGELESLPIPTVAVVDGFALGGGTELALGCDLRVGGRQTRLALPEVKLGIIPGAGGTQRLTRIVGVAKAKELIFTGRRIDGEEAERTGLLNVLAREPQTALDEALILSRQILTSAPLSLKAAKTAITAAPQLDLEKGLDLERAVYNTLLDSEDRLEGLAAFAEKRRAVFKGR